MLAMYRYYLYFTIYAAYVGKVPFFEEYHKWTCKHECILLQSTKFSSLLIALWYYHITKSFKEIRSLDVICEKAVASASGKMRKFKVQLHSKKNQKTK